MIGLTLDLPVEEREEGTMVTSVLAALNHWDMVRVHDVEKKCTRTAYDRKDHVFTINNGFMP